LHDTILDAHDLEFHQSERCWNYEAIQYVKIYWFIQHL